MNAANEAKDVSRLSLAQTARALAVHYLGNRKVLLLLAVAIVGAGLALNWSWLVAAGIAPILLALAPCAAMCALGLCMSRMGGKSCSSGKDTNGRPQERHRKGQPMSESLNIGSVAEASGLPAKTIRYYESIGLIRPAGRHANGYRRYSETDMRTLAFIKRARGLGFSVEEMRVLLDLWADRSRRSATVRSLATKHIDALDRKIAELQSMREALAHLVKRCHGDTRPECPILSDLERSGL